MTTKTESVGDRVLLGYNAGGSGGLVRLSGSAMTHFGLDWLYGDTR